MKQKLFLAAMAAIAMTSCSNDETLEINTGTERAIDFRTAMATRATETTTANLDKFYVTAFNENKLNFPYFENLEFKRTEAEEEGESTYFTSEDKYYYPGDGSSLTFYAYAPSATDLGTIVKTDNTNKNLTLDFSPAEEISKQVDFITANATGSKNDAELGVALKFAHRLSQIEIKGKSENTSYDFKVKGIRIGKVCSKASFDFKNGTWELSEDEDVDVAIYEKVYADDADPTELSAEATSFMAGDNAMLLPQRLEAWQPQDSDNTNKKAYLSVLVRVTTKAGALVYPFDGDERDYAWAAIPVGIEWAAGKKYVYTLDFTTGAGFVDPTEDENKGESVITGEIKFTVDVEAWSESEEEVEVPRDPNLDIDEGEFPDQWED
ncbi:fimbrillin family protein [Bacteroides acidifaciens]|uniref:fimbrillin family protein n=1 Tax=Bacteroides acidifaciens TaxID=85831 RepID=UPI00046ABFF5|nr:fimbrillin family protein [Bacteroides acidifaciens]MCR1997230.1 fimbrillin family protein [Bacteroides acidifaciens]